jgi:hypothetical protein
MFALTTIKLIRVFFIIWSWVYTKKSIYYYYEPQYQRNHRHKLANEYHQYESDIDYDTNRYQVEKYSMMASPTYKSNLELDFNW